MELAAHQDRPSRARVLICDEVRRIQIGRAAGLPTLATPLGWAAAAVDAAAQGSANGFPLATADLKFSIRG
jgi:hypothetical protein